MKPKVIAIVIAVVITAGTATGVGVAVSRNSDKQTEELVSAAVSDALATVESTTVESTTESTTEATTAESTTAKTVQKAPKQETTTEEPQVAYDNSKSQIEYCGDEDYVDIETPIGTITINKNEVRYDKNGIRFYTSNDIRYHSPITNYDEIICVDEDYQLFYFDSNRERVYIEF